MSYGYGSLKILYNPAMFPLHLPESNLETIFQIAAFFIFLIKCKFTSNSLVIVLKKNDIFDQISSWNGS